jgi:gliding motility-associated lipoprotein GldK
VLEDEMYLPEHERFYSRRQFDTRKYNYRYEDVDIVRASSRTNKEKGKEDRSIFIEKPELNIFPDTLVWTSDYTYSYNDPLSRNYFHHPAFDDYPVVGVSWKQAVAFSKWRTHILDNYLNDREEPLHDQFRLPSESEWEYAARGGYDLAPYPWGGPYTTNDAGCFLANFKPRRGNYTADGGLRTVKVASYNPNNFGLYDMAGNVAEWTSNAYDESAFNFAHDMNFDFNYDAEDSDPEILKRKVIRGGSWKDISHFMQVGTRDYEFQDTAKSYIGFRNVISFIGRDKADFR